MKRDNYDNNYDHPYTSGVSTHSSGGHIKSTGQGTVCRHWLRGKCRLGVECHFSHVNEPTTRCESGVCRYYSLGHCSRGDDCTYEHQNKWKRSTNNNDSTINSGRKPTSTTNQQQGGHYDGTTTTSVNTKTVPKRVGGGGYKTSGMYSRVTYPMGTKPTANTTNTNNNNNTTTVWNNNGSISSGGTAWTRTDSEKNVVRNRDDLNNKESQSDFDSILDDRDDLFGPDISSNNQVPPTLAAPPKDGGFYSDKSNEERSDMDNNNEFSNDGFSPPGVSSGMMIVTSLPPIDPSDHLINNTQYIPPQIAGGGGGRGVATATSSSIVGAAVGMYDNPRMSLDTIPNGWYPSGDRVKLRVQLEAMSKEELVDLALETKCDLERHKVQLQKQKRILTRKMIPELVEALEPIVPLDDLLCEEYIPCAHSPDGVMRMDDFWAAYGFDGIDDRKPAYQVFNTNF